MKKYRVKTNLNMIVEAKNKTVARKAVNDVPWEDVIDFNYPQAGFVREFRINADTCKITSVKGM